MLTVTGCNTDAVGKLTVDVYVPFNFGVEPWRPDEVITWYHRDNSRNALEFRIDSDTGDLSAVTLVMSDRPIEDAPELPCHLLPTTPGLPVFASGAVDGRVFEQRRDFSILRANNDFGILWSGWSRATDCMGLDRISFLLAETAIVGVFFLQLTDAEMETVEMWDKFRQPTPQVSRGETHSD